MMRTLAGLFGAAVAVALIAGASSAGATTIFTQIDQPTLDTFGTATFGATTSDLGLFSHDFAFTTSDPLDNASASVVTIELQSGKKDIDFSSVTLDGAAFTHTGFDPFAETWGLTSATLTPGTHHIVLNGTVVSTGPAASYSGTLNIAEIIGKGGGTPEPETWALMILGFGGSGLMLRSRRRIAARAA